MTSPATARAGSGSRVAVVDGARLRQSRAESGLSQENLAFKARVSLTTLARLERGQQSRCRGHTVGRLAAVLGLPAEAMLAVPADAAHTPDQSRSGRS